MWDSCRTCCARRRSQLRAEQSPSPQAQSRDVCKKCFTVYKLHQYGRQRKSGFVTVLGWENLRCARYPIAVLCVIGALVFKFELDGAKVQPTAFIVSGVGGRKCISTTESTAPHRYLTRVLLLVKCMRILPVYVSVKAAVQQKMTKRGN